MLCETTRAELTQMSFMILYDIVLYIPSGRRRNLKIDCVFVNDIWWTPKARRLSTPHAG